MPSDTCNDMIDVPLEVQHAGSEAVSMYVRLRSEGFTHKWAEMCALQQPPGVRGTDRAVMQGRNNQEWLNEMPPHQARKILREAKAAGINVSGRFYMSGLADKRAHRDPAAWIDSGADILRVAKERNLTVQGIVEHKGTPVPPPKRPLLSERLTREMMAREKKFHPKLKKQELREMVQHKYGRKQRDS